MRMMSKREDQIALFLSTMNWGEEEMIVVFLSFVQDGTPCKSCILNSVFLVKE